MKTPLTKKQRDDLEAFRSFVKSNERAPQIKEFAHLREIANGTAWNRLQALVEKGYLIKEFKRSGIIFEPTGSRTEVTIWIDQHNKFLSADSPPSIRINVRRAPEDGLHERRSRR